MSDFSANIKAILDTSGIPGQIKNIEKNTTITLGKFTLNTKDLPSQIQASLDKHKFTISLDGIKTSDIDTLNSSFEATSNKISTINAKTKNMVSNLTKISVPVSALKVQTLDNKMSTWLEKNSRAAKDFGEAIASLRNRLKTLNDTGKLTGTELNNIQREFKEIQQAAIAAGKTGKSFGASIKGAFQSITRYVGVSTIIYQSISALKEMFNNVVSIDTAMTELKKVTNETAESYSKFLSNSGSTAKEIGSTVTGIISSTADFARLGYSFEDSQELAKVANIYAVVGDEIDSVDTATKSIISTLAAYKDEITDAIQIVDKFNEVSNNFAISSGGIGDALQNSASSLAAANNSLDQSIALITAANTVVQDPDSVGKQKMPTIKITISVKSQRWSRPRKDFVAIATRQLLMRVFYFIEKVWIYISKECTYLFKIYRVNV